MLVKGNYEIVTNTPFGELKSIVTLEVIDKNLSGKIMFNGNETEISGGQVTGNTFEFETNLGTPLGKMKATIKGFVEGDHVSGDIKVFMGTFKFSGKRI